MQLTRPVIIAPPDMQSVVTAEPVVETVTLPVPTAFDKIKAAARWVFDIDDGAGAVVSIVCVLAVFGVLVSRLAQLDSALDSQAFICKPINPNSLQMDCHFE